MIFSPRSSRIKPRIAACALLCLALSAFCPLRSHAQAGEDALSQREVDNLRDTAFTPADRLLAFEHILDDRQHRINDLLAKRHGHTDFASDMHDAMDQLGAIADELNDNLDEYSKQHRDVRKALPKLLEATDRWATALRAPADDEAYTVVRRIALDNVKDTRELVQSLQTELDAYFKAHPDAAKDEKKRSTDPHAVRNNESPQ